MKPVDTALLLPTATGTATQQPTATFTATSTITILPSLTATSAPTFTRTPHPPTTTSTEFMLPLPASVPLASWKEIPVMPGAIAGEETPEMYTYTVDATVEDVRSYYDEELPKVGWEAFAKGTSSNGSLFNIYQQGGKLLTVSAIVQGGVVLVLLMIT